MATAQNLICSSCTKCFAVGAMAHLCQTEGSRHLPTHCGPVVDVDVDLTLTLAVVIVVMVMQQMVMIGFFSHLTRGRWRSVPPPDTLGGS